jgi:hypothetical protein
MMRRAYQAELLKLRRRSVVIASALPAALAVLTTVLTFALAKTSPTYDPGGPNFVQRLSALANAGGMTQGYSLGMSLFGLVALIVTIANTTSEFSLGTLRTTFLAQPNRKAWLGGRLLAIGTLLVVAFAAALVAGIATSYVMAPIRGVDTSAWLSGTGIGSAFGDYVNALLGAAFFGLLGTAIAVVVRSTVPALAMAIIWTFPLEHIIQGSWPTATQVFPGLLFATVAVGGVPDAPYVSALLASLAYAVVALVAAMVVTTRRDVTA